MEGVDLATVKEILGHREIEMTLRYSHLAPAHKAKAMDKLGDALEKITNPKDREAARQAQIEQVPAKLANLPQIRERFSSSKWAGAIGDWAKRSKLINPLVR